MNEDFILGNGVDSVPNENNVTEYDGHWMPPLFTGELTPEILAKKEEAKRKSEEILEKIRAKWG